MRPPKKFHPDPFAYHEIIELEIESLTNLGKGVGRIDGWVVFVPFCLPGEKVQARVYRNDKSYSEADLVEVLRPAPERVTPRCDLFTVCGGCQYQHLRYADQLAWKQRQVAELLQHLAGIEAPVEPAIGSPREYGYRAKITPHFQKPRQGEIAAIGFLKTGRRTEIVDVPQCPIAMPQLSEALESARAAVRGNAAQFKRGATLLLRASGGDPPVITDPTAIAVETVCGCEFHFPAGEFFQNNPFILDRFARYVRDEAAAGKGRYLLDTYCGSGLFCLTCADAFTEVVGIEISGPAVEAAQRNAERNGIDNATFVLGKAETIFASYAHPGAGTAVVIDPPRKGCGREFLQQLFALRPERVVYVSCNPATQIRDLKDFVDAGYTIARVQPFDLFPQTRHLECVATLIDSNLRKCPHPPFSDPPGLCRPSLYPPTGQAHRSPTPGDKTMMTSQEIRQSFLDFFREKQHSIVNSSSLMPESPNLLFTNAGMNQFVPYFLGARTPPYHPPRAADTQKCVRAGGKHNDLEDVGYDTYHHTFFEMLGNWSFGDYFKEEAIAWAWELLTGRWKLPPERLYATVYKPGPGDPGEFDLEAYEIWVRVFKAAGLDPDVHIVDGGKVDNFWMMGETGPCGPCSEIHMDLTSNGDTRGSLVNKDDSRCIEIWNLVFIQYNAEPDGSFLPLPARHVDTGMGFERVCSIIQGTNGLTDFSKPVSNYNTDVFTPVFARLEELSGRKYTASLPKDGVTGNPQEETDVAFRVIADHLRTLSFSIADGILPGNKDRNYVLRRILRRAVRYGRTIGLGEGRRTFLSGLVPTLTAEFGATFPELQAHEERICATLDREEKSFNETLDRGLRLFQSALAKVGDDDTAFPADVAFDLSHTYGFPVDLTTLMAREKGLSVDEGEVARLLAEEQKRSSEAQKRQTISAQEITTDVETEFTGYDERETEAHILEIHDIDGAMLAVVDRCPFYVEKGGQIGDTGRLMAGGDEIAVLDLYQAGSAVALHLAEYPPAFDGETPLPVRLVIDTKRRNGIEAHHTATHLLHWALHDIVSEDISQQGSYVGKDRLRFDFNSEALDDGQLATLENAVNTRVAENAIVSARELQHGAIKNRSDIMQFFGDKYGDTVRVVQIGGESGALDGYSMELCGGTHVRQTGEIGFFKIRSEGAIAAGIRRIEALCGSAAIAHVQEQLVEKDRLNRELEAKLLEANKTLGKERAAARAREADSFLRERIAAALGDDAAIPHIVVKLDGDGNLLQEMLNNLRKHQFEGVGVFAARDGDKVHVGIFVHDKRTGDFQAGKLMQELAPLVGGRGGGKPQMARGAGSDPAGIGALLDKAKEILSA